MPKNAKKIFKHGYDIQRMDIIVLFHVDKIAPYFKRDTDKLEFPKWVPSRGLGLYSS